MGFTGVVWASRSTEQLARDLVEGPGPASIGSAGAAWIRVSNEFSSVSADFDKLMARLRTAWDSQASSEAAQRLTEFSNWLQAVSLSAAANGQWVEEAAIANTVAVLAMPNVSEAIEAKAAQDMMASLAAYNGAVLTGSFAEFDRAATADQANAAAVMTQYEEAVAHLAQPWEQPLPPQTSNGLATEQKAQAESGVAGSAGGASGGGTASMPLAPMLAAGVQSSADPKSLKNAGSVSTGVAAGAGMGSGMAPYAPMAGMARGDQDHAHESVQPGAALAGAGEAAAEPGQPWLPDTAHNNAPFMVSSVSWGPDTAVFDEFAAPEEPAAEAFAEEPGPTLEQVDDRWVSPAVIGVDRGLRL